MKAYFNRKKFSGKNKFVPAALILILVCLLTCGIYLATRDADHSENPIKLVNENRSQILVTGEKYALSYEQEQEYIEQEKKREEIREENKDKIEEQSGITSDDNGESEEGKPGGGNGSDGTEGNGDNVDEGQDESKKPRIECSLKNGQHVSGNYLSFDVKATSYKKVVISSFDMHVTINGTRVGSSGTSPSGWVTYKDDGLLVDGNNTITIKATDEEGYSAKATYIVNVDKNAQRPQNGHAIVIVDAPSIGMGTFFKKKIPIYEGENVASVMLRAFEDTGYRATFTGSVNHGFYLNRVYKPGMLAGWTVDKIHPLVKAHLDDINATFYGLPEPDSLGEKDIYKDSGWVVSYNSVYGDGMSTVPCGNGDIIRLSFTLNMGDEYNGNWPDCRL